MYIELTGPGKVDMTKQDISLVFVSYVAELLLRVKMTK